MTPTAGMHDMVGSADLFVGAMSVAICDPEQLVREGLQLVLGNAGLEVRHVASCLAGWEGAADVIVWGVNGVVDATAKLEQLQAARSRHPDARFVVVVGGGSTHMVRQLATAGADAVLSRDISGKVLHRALDLVMLGQQLFPASALAIPAELPVPPHGPTLTAAPGTPALPAEPGLAALPFSERERQILRCLVNGSSNKMIARELDITEATVKVHIKGLLRKIGASNRTQAAIWSLANGFGKELAAT